MRQLRNCPPLPDQSGVRWRSVVTSERLAVDRASGQILQRLWMAEIQIDRFWDDWNEEFKHMGTDSPLGPVERSKVFARFSGDQHFLLVALGNLVKAVGAAEELTDSRFVLDGRLRGLIIQLRNLHEHWEKERAKFPDGQTGAKFSSAWPDQDPWSVVLEPERGALLGGVLSIEDLSRSLEELYGAVAAWARSVT